MLSNLLKSEGMGGDVHSIRTATQLQAASARLQVVTDKLERAIEMQANTEQQQAKERVRGDWTAAYSQWSDWEDTEELNSQKQLYETQMASVAEKPDFMGHYHDHGEERKFFELPEEEKMVFCERHRALGNVLFEEGLLPKATEQYKLALSYYEYCFPDIAEEQKHLDGLRHACLCNISLCYLRLNMLRQSVEAASHVIREDGRNAKAHYRRAQAYRALDEYE